MIERDPYFQTSPSQARLQDTTNTANNFITGVSSDFRNYNPSNSKFASVATTRAGSFDPQRGIANFYGSGRYGTFYHSYANSSSTSANANRLTYLAPSASRPNAYYWGQPYSYGDPNKAVFANQWEDGLSFYRLSDGNKVVVDNYMNTNRFWIWYNQINLDNNLLTISNVGALSKIEDITTYQDRTDTPATPLLLQTHGGMGANNGGAMVTDYARDSAWATNDRDTYIIYRPNFGSNKQLPADVETMGEWVSNATGGRSGSKRKKK